MFNRSDRALMPLLLTLCLLSPINGQTANNHLPQVDPFAKNIRPLLQKYCADCHAPGEMAGIDFLAASSTAEVQKHRQWYADVTEQLQIEAMPPRDYDQPSELERKQILTWIKQTLDLKPAEIDRIGQYVVEIVQDSQGNLWFGTVTRGVARFDGKKLTRFGVEDGLPSLAVPSITEDKAGTLWIGTQDGVCRFDGQRFVRLGQEVGLPPRSQASPRANGQVFATRAGNLWICVGTKAYRMNDGQLIQLKLPADGKKANSYAILEGAVSLKLEDRQGNLWFSVDGQGVYRYDGKTFTRFSKTDGLCSNNVTGILEDTQGHLWFTCMQSYQPRMTGDGGLCRFDGTSFTAFPEIKGLADNDLYTIFETSDGDIWIGATGVGAYRYDGNKFKLFTQSDQPHRIRNFGLQSIAEDRDGTVWFGFSGGLFRFNGESFFHVSPQGPWKNPTKRGISRIEASQRFRKLLVAPEGWMEEVIECPPSFAPTMSVQGLEHLRFPPEYRQPKSAHFMSYLFAIESSEPIKFDQQEIGQQLLLYFRGLATGQVDQEGKLIDTNQFKIEKASLDKPLTENEYQYVMTWQEPFAKGTPLQQNLRVKVMTKTDAKTNEKTHVLFVCCSPQALTSPVWDELLQTRHRFQQRWQEK